MELMRKINEIIDSVNSYETSYLQRTCYERIEGSSSNKKNLNNYKGAGFYAVKTVYVDNCPPDCGAYGYLLVYPWLYNGVSTTYVCQEFSDAAEVATNRRWIRHETAEGTWTPWVLQYSSDAKPTPAEIGAAAAVHSHSEYASTSHNHDSLYAAISHTHTEYASSSHNHDSVYATKTHSHSDYASVSHNHDNDYASINHTHSGYASSSHSHSASNITSGTLDPARLPYASSSSRGAVRISYSGGNLYIYTQ